MVEGVINFEGSPSDFKNTSMFKEVFITSKNEELKKEQDMDNIIEDIFDPLFSKPVIKMFISKLIF
jgi:hypothetical protein